ncbi:hypothetical protein HPC49_19345 [Pyxidicoccus fallax]|uniref:Pilus assembly protein n=1 Tax=Pyxidicoccus fallax TaxID=394095 RepID=A0A848L686_9BACT|nr:pilus assembly protein [Pyxidicoccus fallax]NMO14184.1 pilus assembly protein [Pyxidicoccus fallax]NPC80368.1 hypothetical protein [Pyxidicoccus fallax]
MASLRSRTPRRARGAATVEFAVSLLVLIPVLLYAIYAGELFLAGTRAQEAEITAGWDLTAYRMHDYLGGDTGGPGGEGEDSGAATRRRVIQTVPPRLEQELKGLDSYHRNASTREGRRMLLSEQSLRRLGCQPFNVEGGDRYPLRTFEGIPNGVRHYLHRGSYMACRAEVGFRSPYMPGTMREGFMSRVDLLPERLRNGFTMCGVGRSLRGCDGAGFLILTDDWGLEDSRESRVAAREEEKNERYYRVGNSVYHRSPEPVEDPEQGGLLEGGWGARQVRTTMDFLLDTRKDYGLTSDFKFGFTNPSSEATRFPVDEGMDRGHLTPWDDGEGTFLGGEEVNRDAHHFLGHPDEDFNQP